MPPAFDGDMEWVKRCQNGDLYAFEHLFNKHAPNLLGIALRMLKNRADAEDAVQQTFIRLHRSLARFRFESRFSTFLYRILFNVCFDLLKARKRVVGLDEQISIGEEARWDQRLQLEHAIARLPERMRACFILFAVEGWPLQDIAEALKLSLGGVKSTIYQARVRLRIWLKEYEPER